jgi:hypothetical protein
MNHLRSAAGTVAAADRSRHVGLGERAEAFAARILGDHDRQRRRTCQVVADNYRT